MGGVVCPSLEPFRFQSEWWFMLQLSCPPTVLCVFDSIPHMPRWRVSLGLAWVQTPNWESPFLITLGYFLRDSFYISSGQKDGLLLNFSVHAFQQFHLTRVKWREKEGRKRIIRIFSQTRHSRAPSLVPVPLSRETGFLLGSQVLAVL